MSKASYHHLHIGYKILRYWRNITPNIINYSSMAKKELVLMLWSTLLTPPMLCHIMVFCTFKFMFSFAYYDIQEGQTKSAIIYRISLYCHVRSVQNYNVATSVSIGACPISYHQQFISSIMLMIKAVPSTLMWYWYEHNPTCLIMIIIYMTWPDRWDRVHGTIIYTDKCMTPVGHQMTILMQ